MRGSFLKSRTLWLACLCLILGSSGGVRGMWFSRPGEGWLRNRVIWQRPAGEETDQRGPVMDDTVQYRDTADLQGSWFPEEEDDKRGGQLSSKILFNLIRGKGRSSTTKRSVDCELNEFRCAQDGSCIPQALVCNTQADCPGGTDEDECKFPDGPASWQPSGVRRGAHYPLARYAAKKVLTEFNECVQKLNYGLRIAGPFTRGYNCPVGFSKCALQGQCYDDRFACDGYIDCMDASDELNCASTPCPAEGYIKCDNRWQCFDRSRTCDGVVDCNDGSDERRCEQRQCLGDNQVKCGDKKQCYREDYTCDAIIDCADGSDENNCSTYMCGTGFRKCADNQQCFNASMMCDGIVQCVDGSDEADCPAQGQNNAPSNNPSPVDLEWKCQHEPCADGSKCYLWNLRCDGIPACGDGSDEWSCATSSCPAHKVKCEDRSQCIWEEWLCDGEVHCNDGSEERGCSIYVPQVIQEATVVTEDVDAFNTTATETVSSTEPTTPMPTTCGTQAELGIHTASPRIPSDKQ